VRDRLRLEPDAALEQVGERAHDRPLRLVELDAHERAGGLGVAKVGEEREPVGLDEQGDVRALEPGQVEDVVAVRDEERLLEQLAQSVDAAHAAPTRNSSASR